MRCSIPEISWHNRDPVLSVDIQPTENPDFFRLASGGSDCHVLIWSLKIRENGGVSIELLSDLTRHQRPVNVVRWSPSGQYLACGDDDANIIIWTLKTDNVPLLDGDNNENKETWITSKVLRGHKEDVYDVAWSPDGSKLISGSIDNTAIIWDCNKGNVESILSDHKGYVQGVCWDPNGDYMATLSNDGTCRLFEKGGKRVKCRTHKGHLPVPESHPLFNTEVIYFPGDIKYKSYFRRLSFTPDGSLLLTPSGHLEEANVKVTYVFTLEHPNQPIAMLPSPKRFSVCVRCCPLLFELHPEGPDPVIALPYRMVVAVATEKDVVLYDTQQLTPFAHFQDIHYTRITDLAWSPNGMLLVASSSDGYCTLITFEEKELGVTYTKEENEAEDSVMDMSGCEELEKIVTTPTTAEPKKKQLNVLEKWAVKRLKMDENEEKVKEPKPTPMEVDVPESTPSSSAQKSTPCGVPKVNHITPRKAPKRIVPIKIGECGSPKATESNATDKNKTKVDGIPDNDCSSVNKAESSQKETLRNVNKPKADETTKTPSKTNHLLEFLKRGSPKDTKLKVPASQTAKQSIPQALEVIEISDDDDQPASDTPKLFEVKKKESSVTVSYTESDTKREPVSSPDLELLLEPTMVFHIDEDTNDTDFAKKLDVEMKDTSTTPKSTTRSPAKDAMESSTREPIILLIDDDTNDSEGAKSLDEEKKESSATLVNKARKVDVETKENLVELANGETENGDVTTKVPETNAKGSEDGVKAKTTEPLNQLLRNICPKTPRRIPLVTLSSPKGKKKKQ